MIQNIKMNSMYLLAQETEIYLASVSELFAQCLIEALMVECRKDVEVMEGCYIREVRKTRDTPL